jgi:hypothetical protein
MVAYAFRMPAGIPGDVNRIASAHIETQVVSSAAGEAPTAYGLPVVLSSTSGQVGNVRVMTAADTALQPYGFIVRPYPTQSSQDPLNVSTPPTSGLVDILKRGYMTVQMQGPNAAVKGAVPYIFLGTTNTTHPVLAALEAQTATGAVVMTSNSYFMGPADSNGMVEIAFNL